MLKLAVVTHYFPTSEQPWAGHSAYQTLRHLAKRCEVKVFYPLATYPRALCRWNPLPQQLDPGYQPAGVCVQYIPYPAFPVLSRPLNGLLAGRYLLPHVRQFRPDLILSYVIYPDGFAALHIGRKLKLPVSVEAIGSDLNRISDPVCGMLTRQVLRKATRVCTVSEDLRSTAIRMGAPAQSSAAILNGCDTSIFYPRSKEQARNVLGIPPGASVLVYVGRLDMRKGLRELITAVSESRETRRSLRCFLVGDGPAKPLLISAIEQQHAQDCITIVPPCPTDEVALWMAAADAVTLPSYAEGCPNVVLEALASGRPVVASNVGGIPELMDESVGRLVPPRDVLALTTAINEVLAIEWRPSDIAARHARSWSDVAGDLERHLVSDLGSSAADSRTSQGALL